MFVDDALEVSLGSAGGKSDQQGEGRQPGECDFCHRASCFKSIFLRKCGARHETWGGAAALWYSFLKARFNFFEELSQARTRHLPLTHPYRKVRLPGEVS